MNGMGTSSAFGTFALMTSFVDWLNDNAGAIQAVATVTLILVTSWYVWLTSHLVRETRRVGGPHVFFEVIQRGGGIDSVLRNAGQRAAENIQITVEQDVILGDKRGFLGWPMFQGTIPFLPPGRSISQPASNTREIGKVQSLANDAKTVKYRITYSDGTERYDASFSYDLGFLVPVGGNPFPLAGNDLGLLRAELQMTNKVLAGEFESLRTSLTWIANAINERTKAISRR